MKRLIRTILLSFVLLVLLGVAAAFWLFHESYRGFEGESYVRLERGTGSAEMARALEQTGAIRFAWEFWVERLLHPNAKLQAGEYRFDRAATPGEVFHRIERGDVFFFEFTVPEGSNIFDIGSALEQRGVMSAADFQNAAGDPALIRDLAPSAPTLEGFLFPATYRINHMTTAPELCKQMTDNFRRQWKKIAHGRSNVQQTVTLASLVEKETGVAAERPLVASVFTNRLNKGMRLECDPTTIYAALLENRYRKAIYKSDLASRNPYNTYQHEGLPPGPIANPGLDSLEAALHPAETDYYYFVAKAEGGGHNFSNNLAAHNKATQQYRKRPHKSS
jgi:UPF0755 protein